MGAPKFDAAPIQSMAVLAAHYVRPVTMIYPYYDNPSFLSEQLRRWRLWKPALRDFVSLIVVDDGSPSVPASAVLKMGEDAMPFDVRLFRISVDVRWNWLAARNIGMHHAEDGWCVLTDMDHVIPEETMEVMTRGNFDEKVIYTFQRREYSGAIIHRHPNSMFMTKAMFWKVGGYDEALSGHYGTDGDWRRRCAAKAEIRCMDAFIERHEYRGDSSTTRYMRKQPEDAGKKAIIAKRGRHWKPKTLSFPFYEVEL